jgi:hypothetical protein
MPTAQEKSTINELTFMYQHTVRENGMPILLVTYASCFPK